MVGFVVLQHLKMKMIVPDIAIQSFVMEKALGFKERWAGPVSDV